MDEQSCPEDLSEILRDRINNLKLLQTADQPTPRMRQRITVAIELYSKALELEDTHPLDPEYLGILDLVQDRLEKHWTEAHGNLASRCRLVLNLAFFQRFLARTLLEDYSRQPYSPSPLSLHRAFLVRYASTHRAVSDGGWETPDADAGSATSDSKEGLASHDTSTVSDANEVCGEANNPTRSRINNASSSGSSDSDSLESDALLEEYARDVVYPLEELLLEGHTDAIKEKLLALEPERRYPGGEIQRLIDHCDWPGLFAAINSDRRLSIDLFRQKPVVSGVFKDHTKETVWTGMDKIRDKYFTKSKDGKKYTVTKYARRLSSKKAVASGSIGDEPHPTLSSTPGEGWEGMSWRVAENIFKTFASGLASGPTNAALRLKMHTIFDTAKQNEKDPLLRPDDQLFDQEKAE
ncbi:hypothetical protein INS49_007133 [Diaporthe citri]|uniref:uncharacterized protein n=1 Tax=Diaporthe citri TaxID=83186 RepID=UPI001C7E89BD|nr:uncharacterized protein INS49_007133 [Diaporthe citri]KAG6365522.1 hypothetical protein INS49_007133 [Diaporthe citri]